LIQQSREQAVVGHHHCVQFRSRSQEAEDEVEEEEEEEEGLFNADAVNEEDPERDRATQV